MEKFEEFVCEDLMDGWVVSAYDTETEENLALEIGYWDLVSFVRSHYDFTRKEAIDYLIKCGEEETYTLLKQYFKRKFK